MKYELLKSPFILCVFSFVSTISYFANEESKQDLLTFPNSLLAENIEALSIDIEDEMACRLEASTWVGKIDLGVGPQEHENEEIPCSNDSCWITRTTNLIKCDGQGVACAHWRITCATVSHQNHNIHISPTTGREEPTDSRVLSLIAQYQN